MIEEYRARPLNGFWATAPYLHNGSVPDLVELLKPAAERPATFYVGNWEFDPERLGFEWASPFPGAFAFDTSLPGNSNAGHDYGTDLSAEDQRALIEYLKTLDVTPSPKRTGAMVRIHLLLAVGVAGGRAAARPPPATTATPLTTPAAGLHPLEAYEGGSKQAEDRFIGAAQFFGRPARPASRCCAAPTRSAHALPREFEIYDLAADADLPDDLALGVFAAPGVHDARVRFSNGFGTPADPAKASTTDYDARAMAIQMELRWAAPGFRPAELADLSDLAAPGLPADGAARHRQGAGTDRGAVHRTASRRSAGHAAERALPRARISTFTRRRCADLHAMPDAYRLETYWSGKAHQLGENGVPVKYIARPCNSNGIYVPTKAVDFSARSDDFLQTELERHLNDPLAGEAPACFDFYVQPLRAEAMTGPDGRVLAAEELWRCVEDTTLEWKETEARPHRVGRIWLRARAAGGDLRRPGELHQLLDQLLAGTRRAGADQPGETVAAPPASSGGRE